jgi:hypothetical protein
MPSSSSSDESENREEDNIFSQPWNKSDVVLVVGERTFHVHRAILSLQSPVFTTMFNGNFKDATQEKIELKDENCEAMLQFLKLLYPNNMLDGDKGEVGIKDENIFKILKIADKYAAVNIIKQCMKETKSLKPENTLRLLPYAVGHQLPLDGLYGIIARRVSIGQLEKYAPELGNDSIYQQCLVTKCRYLEKRNPNWRR